MDDLNNVSNDTHDDETNSDGARDLEELPLIGYSIVSQASSARSESVSKRTLCATVDELSSVPDELLGDFSHLLELVGHDERVVGGVFGVRGVGAEVWKLLTVSERVKWSCGGGCDGCRLCGLRQLVQATCVLWATPATYIRAPLRS